MMVQGAAPHDGQMRNFQVSGRRFLHLSLRRGSAHAGSRSRARTADAPRVSTGLSIAFLSPAQRGLLARRTRRGSDAFWPRLGAAARESPHAGGIPDALRFSEAGHQESV